ncbi:MAG: DUF1203 domain-containing protein [Sphingomonadaceae bacterium]|nr:DUF1203 domain-containing protein [Sphingomonadaceae bacterium]
MTYRIKGLDPARFADTAALIAGGAIRKMAEPSDSYPCRVTLADAEPGETVILLNYLSADVDTPFRATHAIYIREGAKTAPVYDNAVPAYLDSRPLSLRGFGLDGMIHDAAVAEPGGADAGIRALLDRPEVSYVDVHHAAYGCFLARADRA